MLYPSKKITLVIIAKIKVLKAELYGTFEIFYLVLIHFIFQKTEDQRLIYSGQLLTDSVILKDVLRPYDEDGQLNRTVHLVCASSSCCIPPKGLPFSLFYITYKSICPLS